jgi:hypothetical protein
VLIDAKSICYTNHAAVMSCLGSPTEGEKTPWPESASELYRPDDCRVSAKLVPTFADRGCHVISVTDPYGHILDCLVLG